MKRTKRKNIIRIALCAGALASLAGCSGTSNGTFSRNSSGLGDPLTQSEFKKLGKSKGFYSSDLSPAYKKDKTIKSVTVVANSTSSVNYELFVFKDTGSTKNLYNMNKTAYQASGLKNKKETVSEKDDYQSYTVYGKEKKGNKQRYNRIVQYKNTVLLASAQGNGMGTAENFVKKCGYNYKK